MTSLSVDEDVEPPEFSFIAGRNAMPQPFLKCFLAKLNILLSYNPAIKLLGIYSNIMTIFT